MREIWKDVKGFEGLYQVSNFGNIKSFYKHGRILKPKEDKDGYLLVNLYKNKKCHTEKIHRLVAKHFISNDENLPQINHKDLNRKNNNINNLEWCDAKYNNNYGNKNEFRSKKVNQYDINGNFIKTWNCIRKACIELNISHNIYLCCIGKLKTCGGYVWRYAKED